MSFQRKFAALCSPIARRAGDLLFLLALGKVAVNAAFASDVSYYAIIESQQYVQTTASGAVLPSTNAWVFDALVVPANSTDLVSASIQPPSGAAHALTGEAGNEAYLFEQRFNSEAAMTAIYPTGEIIAPTYALTMVGTHDGTRTGTLGFDSSTYPNVPVLNNFQAAQSVDTTAPFKLSWSLSGGTTTDVIQVTVVAGSTNISLAQSLIGAGQVVLESPAPFSAGGLNGTSNAFVMPANALPPGTNLQAHLSLARPVGENVTSYAGATGVAILGIDIEFPLVTRPAPLRPSITLLGTKPAPRLQFVGETNRNYHVQFTTNLLTWADLLVTNSPTGTGIVTDTNSPLPASRFYRIQVGP